MAKLSIAEGGQKIDVVGIKTPKVDYALVEKGLGAKLVNIPEISKEEAEQYKPLCSFVVRPVYAIPPSSEESIIYYFGSKELQLIGKSLDDVVGYRILSDEERQDFYQQKGVEDRKLPVVCYYTKKQ